MVFHCSQSDSKSPQVSGTLPCILADLNNAVASMVSTRPLISKSSSPSTNPLVTVPSALVMIGITVTFKFHSFSVLKLGPGTYFFFNLLSVLSSGQPERQSLLFGSLSFFFTNRLTEIMWSVCIPQSQIILCVSFSRTDSGLCIYHLLIWSNLIFSHNSQWITLPPPSRV